MRLFVCLAALVLLVGSCDGDAGVPESQSLKPAKAPAGWKLSDLGPVTVAAPPDWTKGATTDTTDMMKTTVWRSVPPGSKIAQAGMSVRVISKPQQPAEKAALALAVNAMATMSAGKPNPIKIEWPHATDAYLLRLNTQLTTGQDKKQTTVRSTTRMAVFDIDDGSQVQVITVAGKAKIPEQVLSTVQLQP